MIFDILGRPSIQRQDANRRAIDNHVAHPEPVQITGGNAGGPAFAEVNNCAAMPVAAVSASLAPRPSGATLTGGAGDALRATFSGRPALSAQPLDTLWSGRPNLATRPDRPNLARRANIAALSLGSGITLRSNDSTKNKLSAVA